MNPCGAAGYGDGGRCMALPTRLYPTGSRCAEHTPARMAGRPEPKSDPMPSGVVLRNRGIARVDANTDPAWKALVDDVIAQLAATGEPFTADDVRARGVPDPHSPKAWGPRFLAASKAQKIRRVTTQPSKRASVHAHHVTVWQGVA